MYVPITGVQFGSKMNRDKGIDSVYRKLTSSPLRSAAHDDHATVVVDAREYYLFRPNRPNA
jgi:hypothetical protein